jgi:hypothetical protein
MAECDEDEEGIKKDKEKHRESKNRPIFLHTHVHTDHAAHKRLRTHGGHSGQGWGPPTGARDAEGRTRRSGSGAQACPYASHTHHSSDRPRELGSGVRAHPAHKPTKVHKPLEPHHLEEAPCDVRSTSGCLWR